MVSRRITAIAEDISTDGAAAMTGRLSGLTTTIKAVTPEYESTTCFIHCEILANRKLSSELHNILNNLVSVVNQIKANALNSLTVIQYQTHILKTVPLNNLSTFKLSGPWHRQPQPKISQEILNCQNTGHTIKATPPVIEWYKRGEIRL
ncbi:SCND3 protein, partial [Polyodon spathula]|nr:SCND3 protein [Polyodon spathula]